MVFDGLVLPRRVPAHHVLGVLGSDAPAPRQVIIHLQEIIVPHHRIRRLHPPEEILHPPFELAPEPGHVAGGVDLRERKAEFVAQSPESGEQDGAREEVVLSVALFEHDRQVVLDHAARGGHGVFGQGTVVDVEGFARGEVVHPHVGFAEEGRVALGEVVAAGNRIAVSRKSVLEPYNGSNGEKLTTLQEARWHRPWPREPSGSTCHPARQCEAPSGGGI